MDLDLFGEPIAPHVPTRGDRHPFSGRRPTQANGYAAAPGSGPDGERCGTCGHHYTYDSRSGRIFHKCALVKATRGAGTDIRVKSPACWRFEAPTPADGVRRTPGTDQVGRFDSGSANQHSAAARAATTNQR